MIEPATKKARPQGIGEAELNEIVDVLLIFDRAVVEFSMNLYNVHPRERVVIREQNRRLHDALRARLLRPPRWLHA